MLRVTADTIEYYRSPFARALLLAISVGSVAAFVFGIVAPIGAIPIWGRLLILVCYPLFAVGAFRVAGRCELRIDLLSRRYTLIDGFPFLVKRLSGDVRADFRAIVISSSEMGPSVYLRWSQPHSRDFYFGLMSPAASMRLALHLGLPVCDKRRHKR
ncbi:MAG TPA: hypothetical protein VKT77_19870 [Chthonomonadaceae bacterium]|nr:hypothetical protein [Chthonomonadaceae bacterium]